MNTISGDFIREVYGTTARRYEMILKIYKGIGVDLKKWRDGAFSRLPELDAPRILDVAVGTGVNIPYLIEKYPDYEEIIGIDYTPQMLARAKKRIREGDWKDITIKLADARALSRYMSGHFDLIISTYSLSIIPESPMVLSEIKKVLDPDGYLMLLDCKKFDGLLSIFNPLAIKLSKQLGGNEQTYSIRVSDIAAKMFNPIYRRLMYAGLFYEDLYQGIASSTS